MQPLVTIITSCYNHEKYLDDYFKGLLEQTYPNIELIIFDDGSTDNSWQIIESYIPELKRRFPSLICERHENMGPLRERVLATSMASGEFICMLDSDDYYVPEKIQENIDYMSAHPEAGAVYSNYYDISVKGKVSIHYKPTLTMPVGKVLDNLYRECFMKPLTTCYRAELFRKHIDYNDYIRRGYGIGDYPTFLTLAHYSEFGYIKKPLGYYRHVEGSLSRNSDVGKWVDFTDRVFRIVFDYMNDYGASPEIKKYLNGLFSSYLLFAGFRLLLSRRPCHAWKYFRMADLNSAIRWLPFNLLKAFRHRLFQ